MGVMHKQQQQQQQQQQMHKQQQQQQQQSFYSPLIQDNPGEPVSETFGHINPTIITILLSTSNQSSPSTTNQHIFLT